MQANDLSSTSLHHSSLSNLNSNPLNPNNKSREVYGCLSNVERCEEEHGNNSKKNHEFCAKYVFVVFKNFLTKHKLFFHNQMSQFRTGGCVCVCKILHKTLPQFKINYSWF